MVGAAVLGLSGLVPAQAPAPASAPSLIFNPAGRVPLSDFQTVAAYPGRNGSAQIGVEMYVSPDLLSALVAYGVDPQAGFEVTHKANNGAVTHFQPTSMNMTTGRFWVNAPLSQSGTKYVVTVATSVFENDLPLVTHWNSSLSSGMGGQEVGATDGIATFELSVAEGQVISPALPAGMGLYNGNTPVHENANGQKYSYNTDLFALFSDGSEFLPSGSPPPLVPSHEHYLAENWSWNSITKEASLFSSDQVRATTGWPVVFVNYDDDSLTLNSYATDDLPAFQLIHGYIVPYEDPTIDGREQSMASILLPPLWKKTVVPVYPVLFTGFYDLNQTVAPGLAGYATPLGELFNANSAHKAIAVLWNGGGALATYVSNESVFHNMNMLMDDCEAAFSADQDAVVMWGGSRAGGTGALMASNNTAGRNYKVKSLWMAGPESYLGEAYAGYSNPTYTGLQASVDGETGYARAWEDGFEALALDPPVLLSATAIVLNTLFGTDDQVFIANNKVASSTSYVNAMETKNPGINIFLTGASHESTQPFHLESDYYHALLANPVLALRLRWDVFYRVGHGGVPEEFIPKRRDLVGNIFDDVAYPLTLQPGVRELHDDPNNPGNMVLVGGTPSLNTVVVEGPVQHGVGQERTWTITGPPETEYEIVYYKVEAGPFFAEDNPVDAIVSYDLAECAGQQGMPSGDCPTRLEGTLPPATNGKALTSDTWTISATTVTGDPLAPFEVADDFTTDNGGIAVYVYYMTYTIPGQTEVTITSGAGTPFRFPFPNGDNGVGDLIPPFVAVWPAPGGAGKLGYNTGIDVLKNRTGGLATD